MSYNSDFERAFIERSLALVKTYEGPYDATLLLNCLLGLLVVPKEACLASIPKDPIEQFHNWGIDPGSITDYGTANNPNEDSHNLRGLVWRLRNSVAHFRFRPEPENGEVIAFHFHDVNGFKATVKLNELKSFVENLADHLRNT
jgi:hypothetical protein